jgi:hypothetical protein
MLVVVLAWLVGGALIGILAHAAHLQRWSGGVRGFGGLRALALLGAGFALVGGGVGTVVFGSVFSGAMAVWVAVLAVVVLPWVVAWAQERTHPRSR